MTVLRVDTASHTLTVFLRTQDNIVDFSTPCTIGRSGACRSDHKREGDGCTPLGTYPVRAALFRPGRAAPPPGFALPWRWVREGDGWSDDAADPAYNRPVHLPHPFSAENLLRHDPLYDVIIILGHNDAPPVPGLGSAIFFHLWNDGQTTEGCVAIAREVMMRILPELRPGDVMEIV